ncbi:MAG: response regulator transcription factor [Flavobacteriales bacterium]|nr:response regulator transcription factor [Flavobacteriales bacterium]
MRIAVTDDHELVRRGVVAALAEWPVAHTVLEACDGVDYEERCRELGHVHLAVVDLRMPRRDGYDTLRWMQRHQPRSKGVAISYDPDPGGVRRALQCGAAAVLPKAVRAAELHRALSTVLSQGFYYNELVARDLRRRVEDEAATRPAETRWAALTPREREVLRLFCRADVPDLADVARRLGISLGTAETHRHNAYTKLGLHSKEALLRFVLTHQLGEPMEASG